MNDLLLRILILGFPFGFSLLWFTYWIVKIYKGKQKAQLRKKEESGEPVTRPTET